MLNANNVSQALILACVIPHRQTKMPTAPLTQCENFMLGRFGANGRAAIVIGYNIKRASEAITTSAVNVPLMAKSATATPKNRMEFAGLLRLTRTTPNQAGKSPRTPIA